MKIKDGKRIITIKFYLESYPKNKIFNPSHLIWNARQVTPCLTEGFIQLR